jgi:hypothetical protein
MQLDGSWVGSVSSGTLREEVLIPVFEDVLRQAGVTPDRPAAAVRLHRGEDLTDAEWGEVSWYVNEDLFDALDAVAPEGTYFGAHPGDGSDFGFWEADGDGDGDED